MPEFRSKFREGNLSIHFGEEISPQERVKAFWYD